MKNINRKLLLELADIFKMDSKKVRKMNTERLKSAVFREGSGHKRVNKNIKFPTTRELMSMKKVGNTLGANRLRHYMGEKYETTVEIAIQNSARATVKGIFPNAEKEDIENILELTREKLNTTRLLYYGVVIGEGDEGEIFIQIIESYFDEMGLSDEKDYDFLADLPIWRDV